MTANEQGVLIDLDDTELMVASPEQDVRGRPVVDRHGDEVGEVDGLMIDEEERRVRFLQVGSGGVLGLGKKTRLIPVDAVTAVDDAVHVDTTVSAIAGGPEYDPDLVEAPPFEDYYNYYGVRPFWATGYLPPVWPPRV